MLMGAEDKIAEQKAADIRRNFDDAVDGIPRWSRRVSDHDRDVLVQALSDLELLWAVVCKRSNVETVRAAVIGEDP